MVDVSRVRRYVCGLFLYVYADISHVQADLCVVMCADMHGDMPSVPIFFADICTDMRADTCAQLHFHICADMFVRACEQAGVYSGICVDICVDVSKDMSGKSNPFSKKKNRDF